METTVWRIHRSDLTVTEYVVIFLLGDIASARLQKRIAHRVVSTVRGRDERRLAVFIITNVANHVEILREQQQIHNVLGCRAFHVAGEFNNTRAESVDDSLALLGNTHTRQVLWSKSERSRINHCETSRESETTTVTSLLASIRRRLLTRAVSLPWTLRQPLQP
jgi:hypothetical protein